MWHMRLRFKPLKCLDCEKDIGIHVDEHLTFSKHIDYIIKKANSVLAVTRRSFQYMDCEIFKNLYKGIIRPQLEYATPVWNPHLKSQIKAIEAVQIMATRMIPGMASKTYPERLCLLNIPTLAYRRLRGDMIHIYKLICNPKEGAFDNTLPELFDKHNRSLRGRNKKLFYHSYNLDIKKIQLHYKNCKTVEQFAAICYRQ